MVSFFNLWHNHPGYDRPCLDGYEDQCAIRMSVALRNVDVDLASFEGVRCSGKRCSDRHVLRAEELANWLAQTTEVGRLKRYYGKKHPSEFYGKRGILFIKDGWGGGDHIDLWEGMLTKTLKAGRYDWLTRGRQTWLWSM